MQDPIIYIHPKRKRSKVKNPLLVCVIYAIPNNDFYKKLQDVKGIKLFGNGEFHFGKNRRQEVWDLLKEYFAGHKMMSDNKTVTIPGNKTNIIQVSF